MVCAPANCRLLTRIQQMAKRSLSRLLWIFSLFLSSSAWSAEKVPAALMIAAHNEVRSQHGLPPMKWSASLAKDAASWADHLAEQGCAMKHAQGTHQGENLFWASPVKWSDGRRE